MRDVKCILHDFADILPTNTGTSPQFVDGKVRFCGFKCAYEINCKVIPQYDITVIQRNEIEENIRNSIYNAFNANLPFVKNVLKNAQIAIIKYV